MRVPEGCGALAEAPGWRWSGDVRTAGGKGVRKDRVGDAHLCTDPRGDIRATVTCWNLPHLIVIQNCDRIDSQRKQSSGYQMGRGVN